MPRLLFLALGLTLAACGSEAGDGSAAPDVAEKPVVTSPGGEPPAELQITDIVTGEGAEAKVGDLLSMQYVGIAWSTGEQFDASWDNGQPFALQIGVGDVILGWDQGIPGMRVGGRRQLVIPPDLAYGPAGIPGVIAADETLVFVVDLIGIG